MDRILSLFVFRSLVSQGMVMVTKILMLIWVFLVSTQAMLSDGIHPSKDYINFVNTQEAFKASCFIYDHHRHILQTGVLIAPDIVMTAAHGFEGKIHLDGIIVGFGDTVARESEHNYQVKALRTHPRYYRTEFPMQAKYDLLFLKLTKPVKGVQPVPLFETQIFNQVPPLYVATFGSADIPHGAPVQRRAFALPESDIFSIVGRDPEALYDHKTVMMGAIFFEPNDNLKPVKPHGPERELRTYKANLQWRKIGKPPYALTLAGSSGAPIFINLTEKGVTKTYVFGIIQSFSHLSASSFHHSSGDRETHRLLHTPRQTVYGHYQSVFCIPYKLSQTLEAYKNTPKTYELSKHVRKILDELETEKAPAPKLVVEKGPGSHRPKLPVNPKIAPPKIVPPKPVPAA